VLAALLGACGDDGLSSPPDIPATLINPYRVWAFSTNNVWILDGSATIHVFDGAGWSQLAAPTPVNCIYALGASDVWLCSNDAVLHYDGSTFTSSDVSTPTGLDGLASVWASSASDVWAVGDDAIVAHYDGTTWSRELVGDPFKSSIWGSGPTDVYALSTFDLSHYDGTSWTEIEIDGFPAGGDGQVWGTGPDDVWLANGDDNISHFDGSTWTVSEEEELGQIGDTSAVWGTGPGNVWAVGSAGLVAHYDGSWHTEHAQKIGAPYLQQMLSVHGSAENDVWIVGRQLGEGGSTGLIYHLE